MKYSCRYRRFKIRQNSWCRSRHTPLSLVMAVCLLPFNVAYAQEPSSPPSVGLAALPRDLSPWGMFMNADVVVKAVMVGLVFASIVTWTVCLAKTIELLKARRRVRSAMRELNSLRTLANVKASNTTEPAATFCAAAIAEIRLSDGAADKDGLKERITSRLERMEAAFSRRISRGTGVLATIGATAPFVGLFGTVWGIMNSFIGISKSHTTNLAVVAPGIAEALLATALGLAAAIPAVVIYNLFARQITNYRAGLADTSAEVLRLVSRDLDRGMPIQKGWPCCSSGVIRMSVRLDHGKDELDEVHEINVTPFIDVILVLLIIFMIAAPLATVDISVDLPSSTAEPQPRPDKPLYLTVKPDLSLTVGDTPIARDQLSVALEQTTHGDRQTRVFVRADKVVPYGELMEVMNLLRAAGFLKIALVGVEKTS